MPTILVVDDNPGDRELVKTYLEEVEDVVVQLASDGQEALDSIRAERPDLVLSDVRMPNMDGLELVKTVHQDFHDLPVILMTSYGSEQDAVEALKLGAASYVSKNALEQHLVETVHDVLQVQHRDLRRDQLMGFLTLQRTELQVGNEPELVPSLVRFLVASLERARVCDARDLTRIGVALQEALDNALYHGNLEISSDLREQDPGLYYRSAEERRSIPPYANRQIHVSVDETPEYVTYRIRDEGPGFVPDDVPDPTDPDNMDKVSGRGLLLIRTFMDEVGHNEVGNEITMTRRFEQSGDSATPPAEG